MHRNYERAAEWYEKAARAGYANAMAGLEPTAGNGVPQSSKRAVSCSSRV